MAKKKEMEKTLRAAVASNPDLKDCADAGIDSTAIQQSAAAPTSYTDVMTVTGTGRRTFFHQHGANALLDLPHFDLGKSSARIFYLAYLCLLRTLDEVDATGRTKASRLFEQARGLGMTTVADLVSNESSDFAAIVNPSLPQLDYLFMSEYELARLVGKSAVKDPGELETQAGEVMERGVHQSVIVHLPEGALCVSKNSPVVWNLQSACRPK